jgi:putative hydrolase
MKPLFDLHTHTVASGHAYSTLKENIEAARDRGLKALGFSDHAPAMPGSANSLYFGNFKVIRETIEGVRIIKGIEANIMDFKGTIDVDPEMGKKLHYVIASLHIPCIDAGTREENTAAIVNTMKNPLVKIIGHPDDDRYPIDHEEVVKAAARERVALEINNTSLRPGATRQNGRKNILILLDLCRRFEVPVVMGSDAHIWYDIGELTYSEAIIRETDFPPELVLNYSMEGLNYVLNQGSSSCSHVQITADRSVAQGM